MAYVDNAYTEVETVCVLLTAVVRAVLDESRELREDVGASVKGLFVGRTEVRISE